VKLKHVDVIDGLDQHHRCYVDAASIDRMTFLKLVFISNALILLELCEVIFLGKCR